MPRKKTPVATFVKMVGKRKRPVTARKNPDEGGTESKGLTGWVPTSLPLMDIGAGLSSYAGTNLVSRVGGNLISRKWAWGRHTPPIIAIVSFLGLLYAAEKSKRLKPYQVSILVGAGIAVIQAILRTWLPGIAWLAGTQPTGQLAASPSSPPQLTKGGSGVAPEDLEDDEADLGSFLDEDADLKTGIFSA